jgi:hypothetical protein
LSRAGLAGSQVIAVMINVIETIYEKASTDEFLYALTEVAEAISDSTKTNVYTMAYAGSGIFLAVSNTASMESSVGMEAKIQSFLDERDSEYDNSDPLDIEVAVGNPLRPSLNKAETPSLVPSNVQKCAPWGGRMRPDRRTYAASKVSRSCRLLRLMMRFGCV